MLTAIVVCLAIFLTLGMPLWMVFLLTSTISVYFFSTTPMVVAAQNVFGALDNWLLLAVPGFIFAGEVMGQSGLTLRLVSWIRSLTGHLPGGLPLTTVVTSELFGAVSGSSAATTAAIGKVLYPGMREEGYSEKFSLGLIASCGALASIIPPSITMILYSAVTNASIGQLFIAGILPGIFIGILLIAYILWYAYRENLWRTGTFNSRQILHTTLQAAWPLGVPLLIFGGIYSGIFTPTESAILSTVYAIVVGMLILRKLNPKQLLDAMVSTTQLTAKVFVIVASSAFFSWVLTAAKVPQTLAGMVQEAAPPAWAILLIINIVLIIAGMFIDPTSCTVVLTPILWPLAEAVGVDIIHFGVVIVVNVAVGMFTPPFGLNLFVTSSIFRVPAPRVAVGVLPFIGVYLVALAFITYWPSLSLFLPGLFQ